MRVTLFRAIQLALLSIIIVGCTHSHTHNPIIEGPANISLTKWSDLSEIFIEFPPLIKGEESKFLVHISDMKSFKAVDEAHISIKLLENGNVITESIIDEASSPGIFKSAIVPEKEGIYDLDFTIKSPWFSDQHSFSGIKVFQDQDQALIENPPEEDGDQISFLKEQAWKTDFAVEKVNRQKIHEVIRTSGEIQPVKGEERMVSAKSSGIVIYKNSNLQEGQEVKKGELLFSINSQGMLESNNLEKYKVAKAKLDMTKANFERAENLLAKQIIGQKEFENRKMEYSVAEAEWHTLAQNNIGGEHLVRASISGIIKNILISEGAYAEEGSPLIEIASNRRLLLHAEVAQNYLTKLSHIETANFKTPYHDDIQSLEDYRGKLLIVGKMLEPGKHFLPVWFELDNLNTLVPGSFVELFLLTTGIENQLVIPKSAIMQDYNVNYVYVQTAGELFEKREIKLGIDDGRNVQVLSGISEGELLVTKGAYQIKMASMSSTIPSHGHTH